MNKKTILLLGGAGYIGSYVNKVLHERGYGTVVVDNLSKGQADLVRWGSFVKASKGDRETMTNIFETHQIDGVMDFAALTDVGESVENPLLYYRENVCQTAELLSMMDVPFYVFSSSAAVYGDPIDSKPFREDDPCLPANPYGMTKRMVEEILFDLAAAKPFHFCSLRYFNAAGGDPEHVLPIPKRKQNNLIQKVLQSIHVGDNEAVIYGTDYPTPDGTCIRDYIHIADLAEAHILAMESLLAGSSSQVVNLGNGKGWSVRQVLKAIEKVTGQKLKVTEAARRAGDPPSVLADHRKAKELWGWVPQRPELEGMVRDCRQAMR